MTGAWPDLDDLALLVVVAETGSIGQAAQRRGVAQPSVSRRMAALERRLGVQVLLRSPRGTTLTPAGRVIVDWAAVLLGAAEDFTRSVTTLRAQAASAEDGGGAVSAGVSMTLAEHLAPSWLAALRAPAGRSAPTVSFVVANSTEVGALVESGELEIGFLESPSVPGGLRRSRFGGDRLVVAVAPGHRWATVREVTIEELSRTPLLVREVGSGTRETIEQALASRGFGMSPALEMASNSALRAAAVAGMGPVVLSDLALASEFVDGRLVPVTVPGLDLSRPFTAVWLRAEPLSPRAKALLAAVRRAEALRRVPAPVPTEIEYVL